MLDSASVCFARHGFKKTSIGDIATEARVAKGTVYLYCESKQDLFYQTVERELRAWISDLSSFIDPHRPANEILAEMGQRDAAFVEQRPLVADLLIGISDDSLPAFRTRLGGLRKLGLQPIVDTLELGIRQGVFADDLDVRATARILQEMQLAGALLHRRGELPLRQVRRQQSAALRLVLLGLERRAPSSPPRRRPA